MAITMTPINIILDRYGGTELNSLTHVIGNNIEKDTFDTNQIQSVKKIPYMNNQVFISCSLLW